MLNTVGRMILICTEIMRLASHKTNYLFISTGYGNVAPVTVLGKLTTIVYAIAGMPLFLLYLSNIGMGSDIL